MPVLTLDVGGLNEMNVECERGGHAAPRKVGARSYSASGSEWSQVRAELMVVPVVLAPLPWSQLATIRTLFANAARVNCAGDIFNKPGTIVCSGTITDDLHTTADRGTGNLTLFEVGSTLTYTPVSPALIYLASPASPIDGSVQEATPDIAASIAGGGNSETLLNGVTIPTCGSSPDPAVTCATVISPSAERVWLLDGAAADGWILGSPTVVFGSTGGTGDHWALQDCMCKIFVVRSGVDVAEWDTGWSNGNGGFGGGTITMSASAVVFPALTGDRIRIELFGRAARHGGYSTTDLQTVSFGGTSGILYLGGDASTLLWPAP